MNYDRTHVVSLTLNFEAMPALPPHTGDPLMCVHVCVEAHSFLTVRDMGVWENSAHDVKNKWHSRWERWLIHNTAQPLIPYCYNHVILSYHKHDKM